MTKKLTLIVLKNHMRNDKYYGSLRSRDNQWGVDLSLSRNQVIITTYIYFSSLYSQIHESVLSLGKVLKV